MGERERRLTSNLAEAHRLLADALAANTHGAYCAARVALIETKTQLALALKDASVLCQTAPPRK